MTKQDQSALETGSDSSEGWGEVWDGEELQKGGIWSYLKFICDPTERGDN